MVQDYQIIWSMVFWFLLGMASGAFTILIIWLRWNKSRFIFTDEQAARVWENVAGRSSGGDPRATTIGWKYIKAVRDIWENS